MAKKLPKDIANEIRRMADRLEISNDIIKSVVDYFDIKELTPSEQLLLDRSKEFLGVKK